MISFITLVASLAFLFLICAALYLYTHKMLTPAVYTYLACVIAQLVNVPVAGLDIAVDGPSIPKVITLLAGGANLILSIILYRNARDRKALQELLEENR